MCFYNSVPEVPCIALSASVSTRISLRCQIKHFLNSTGLISGIHRAKSAFDGEEKTLWLDIPLTEYDDLLLLTGSNGEL